MHKKIRVIATAAFLVMAVGGPAAATHTPAGQPFVPEYLETPVFLTCPGSTKLGNVNSAAEGSLVGWDSTAPTASATAGAGCGTVETFIGSTAPHNYVYDFVTQGTFTGNIKNITVRFWAIELAGSRALNEWTVNAHMDIDGVPILTFSPATLAHAPIAGDATSPARLYEVTINNVGFSSQADHETEHEITLTLSSKFINGSGINMWVYDASEVPSGLIFNDTTPAAVKINRNG